MKIFIFLALLFSTQLLFAQHNQSPVQWSFSSEKVDSTSSYIIMAKAQIEPGWHVFATEPGGDGLLIPTTLTINHENKKIKIGITQEKGKKITEEMEAVGLVHYFKDEVIFYVEVFPIDQDIITGLISFQVCNDKMCLPPEDVNFSINL
ncbi:MAG: protein-disulfide reductase DsbD family protein [Chitinophagaceae bacterium]